MSRFSFVRILLNAALLALPALLGPGRGQAAAGRLPITYAGISFPEARVGWVLAERGTSVTVLRTSDGGRSWSGIARLSVPLLSPAVQFVDARHGWISGLGPALCGGFRARHCHAILLRSVDGGLHWSRVTTPGMFGAPGDVRFVDALHGWLIHAQSPCTSLCFRSLYATSDGGLSWHAVRNAPQMPFMDMSPIDARHVWIGGGYSGSCVVSIYATGDGGRTWTRQLTVPRHCGLVQVGMLDARRGWAVEGGDMQYCSMGGCYDYALYQTVDGGRHWTLEHASSPSSSRQWWNTVTEYGGGAGQPVFVTPRYGWIPFSTGAGPGAGGIAITGDGGRTWRRTLGAYPLSGIALISPTDGWASGTSRLCGASACNGDLLHTVDGGKTWSKQHPRP